jgi:hypothetical protein
MSQHSFGYVPDAIDTRDYQFAAPLIPALPPLLNMRTNHNYPDAYDQGTENSCVGNVVAFGMAHAIHVPHVADQFRMLSRAQIYYLARAMRGWEAQDGGCQPRDGIKAAVQGVADEALWAYTPEHIYTPPTPEVIAAGSTQTALQYSQIMTPAVDNIRAALFTGHPVMFGALLYPAFESADTARTGLVPMPQDGERPIGRHYQAIVGYDHKQQLFCVRNSWSPSYGDNGHMWMPYDYIANLRYCSDFWVIQRVG